MDKKEPKSKQMPQEEPEKILVQEKQEEKPEHTPVLTERGTGKKKIPGHIIINQDEDKNAK